MSEEYVLKRNGESEFFSFDKILARVKNLGNNELKINYTNLVKKIIDRLYDGIPTSDIDELTAQQCASLITTHYDYGILASRIMISNHQKNTPSTFVESINLLYNFKDIHGRQKPLISKTLWEIVNKNKSDLETMIDYDRDFNIDFFGFKTLERAYLMKVNSKIVERPQHMWMRVSVGIHGSDMDKVKTTYDAMSMKLFTHATPTLFNAGTPRPQLSSCYLLAMKEDSIDGIYETLTDCAKISKWAGGIGLHIHNIRATGTHIAGTNGISNGIVPMLRVFNNTARYVDQGGGKRNGSFAIYLEPWHKDIYDFLEMKKTHGDEEARARDLFYALWIPDKFMERVKSGGNWTLMCPNECPGLADVYGDKFNELYEKYESEGRGKVVKAQDLWFKILDSQIETGTPYMLYKDACNKKSNQKNLGTIKSSNLCVSPTTLVLTDKGHLEIQTLKDKTVNVWNGKEFSETIVKQTSDNSELLTISFSDGSELTCTKYHKFYIQTKRPSKMKQDIIKSRSIEIIEAQHLKHDMKLIKCEYPIIDNKKELKSAYTNGFFSGDGTYTNNSTINNERKCNFKSLSDKSYCGRHIAYQNKDEISEYCCGVSYKKKPHVSLYGEKIKLLQYLDYNSTGKEKNNKLNVTLVVDLEDKFFVPLNYSLKSKLDWFSGYCDADGSITRNGTNQALQISCIHKNFLLEIKLMLQTCGVACKVMLNMKERKSYLPNGKGGMDFYDAKELWRILIGSNDLQKLVDLGFSPKRLIINKHTPQRNATQFVKVDKISDNGEVDKTFCFTENKRNAGIFNGVITSQCTEIIEYSDEDESAVCNLASIGLSKFIKKNTYDFSTIVIYTKTTCDYCKLAKAHLTDFDVIKTANYQEINMDDDMSRQQMYKDINEKYSIEIQSVPQIIIDGKHIGGYEELLELMAYEVDHEKLHSITKIITDNLNKVIDVNFYPTEKTKRSNLRHRPVGIGVQGLADLFALMKIPFHSEKAIKLNKDIFETIYHAALEKSNELATERITDMTLIKNIVGEIGMNKFIEQDKPHELIKRISSTGVINTETLAILNNMIIDNRPIKDELDRLSDDHLGAYATFNGSPASEGILQFDMWGVVPSNRYDWVGLKSKIIKTGLRNSLLLAPMPTASTSQILGNNECFEPFTSNIYVRRTIAGEFVLVNKYLMKELAFLNLWTEEVKNQIIVDKGSIQKIKKIPKILRDRFKIVWEIPMKHILNMAKDRGAFIDQSQSTNLWMENPTYKKLTAMHFYAWSLGLKTGLYYLRTKAKATPQQFTIDPNLKTMEEEDICESCSG